MCREIFPCSNFFWYLFVFHKILSSFGISFLGFFSPWFLGGRPNWGSKFWLTRNRPLLAPDRSPAKIDPPRPRSCPPSSHRSHRTCISWIKTIAMNTRTTPARCSPANDLRRLSQMISSLEKDKVWEAAAASAKATRPSQTPSSRYLTDFRA